MNIICTITTTPMFVEGALFLITLFVVFIATGAFTEISTTEPVREHKIGLTFWFIVAVGFCFWSLKLGDGVMCVGLGMAKVWPYLCSAIPIVIGLLLGYFGSRQDQYYNSEELEAILKEQSGQVSEV